jgi:hypothetical protein
VWDDSNAAWATQVIKYRVANVPETYTYGKRKKRSSVLWQRYLVIENFFTNSTTSREERLVWSDEHDVGAIFRFKLASNPLICGRTLLTKPCSISVSLWRGALRRKMLLLMGVNWQHRRPQK